MLIVSSGTFFLNLVRVLEFISREWAKTIETIP
jgi:hypothetical protein